MRLDLRWRGSVRLLALVLPAALAWCPAAADARLFGASQSIPLSGAPVSVRIAQLDDGLVDILVGSSTGLSRPSLSLLFNLRDGTAYSKSQLQTSPVTALAQIVATGDFNGDGRVDFAVAGDDTAADPRHTVVSVYLTDGDASFERAQQVPVAGLFPECLEAADVTGDTVPDLVICHSLAGSAGGRISILAGLPDGSGTFADPVTVPVGSSPSSAAIADLDGDGHADLAVADALEDRLYGLFGTGSGLAAPVVLSVIDGARGVASLGALSRRLFVAGGDQAAATVVQVSGDRSAAVLDTLGLSTGPAVAARAADFDGDGSLDGAVLTKQPNLVFLLGISPDGQLELRELVTLGAEPDAFAADDLSGDAKADLVVASASVDRVFVLVNGVADLPPPALCGSQPAEGCARSTSSKLRLASKEGRGHLAWKWGGPGQSTIGGDPLDEPMTFAFCLYTTGDAGSARLMQVHTRLGMCDGAPCWRLAKGDSSYRDRGSSGYQGVGVVSLSGPARDPGRVAVKGSGLALGAPPLPPEGAPTGVVAQLINDRGACWESQYDAASAFRRPGRLVGTQREAR